MTIRLPLQVHLDKTYVVEFGYQREFLTGEMYHRAHRSEGGVWTPVGQVFAWRPDPAPEGSNRHWRIDCHIRVHPLSPDAAFVNKMLPRAMIEQSLLAEPLWVQCYRSEYADGQAYGDVWEKD